MLTIWCDTKAERTRTHAGETGRDDYKANHYTDRMHCSENASQAALVDLTDIIEGEKTPEESRLIIYTE